MFEITKQKSFINLFFKGYSPAKVISERENNPRRKMLLLVIVLLLCFVFSLAVTNSNEAQEAKSKSKTQSAKDVKSQVLSSKVIAGVNIPQKEATLTTAFDVFEVVGINDNDYLKIEGWTIIPGTSSGADDIRMLVLQSAQFPKGEKYVFETEKVLRPRLTIALSAGEGLNYDKSGFKSQIDSKNLKDGEYKVGVLIRTKNKKDFYSTNLISESRGKDKVIIKNGKNLSIK